MMTAEWVGLVVAGRRRTRVGGHDPRGNMGPFVALAIVACTGLAADAVAQRRVESDRVALEVLHDAAGESEVWADPPVVASSYARGASFQSVRVRLESAGVFAGYRRAHDRDPRVAVVAARESDYYSAQSVALHAIVTTLGFGVAALMAIGAVFGAVNTMYSALAPRTREIATLRVPGFDRAPVVRCRRRLSTPLLAACAVWAGLVAEAAAQGSAASDRAALEALYDATGGPEWADSTNWKTDAPLGEWFGVWTNSDGRVEALYLWANGLTGPIPDALATLGNLRQLHLDFNMLHGPIPAELGNLVNLEALGLSNNSFAGPLPRWLGDLENLRVLWLSNNSFTGPIPAVELGRLVRLEELFLGNDLTGSIPPEIGSLVNLKRLGLSGHLTGPIPRELGSLVNLWELDLSSSDLTGPIPAELGTLTNLEQLSLGYNWGLTGPLPQGLRSSPLERLDIFFTQMCAPASWRDWLETIDDFAGRLCGAGTDGTIDVAVVYTPAARDEAGGTAEIDALVDLVIAESNEAFASSGLQLRLALVHRSEVAYEETGAGDIDLDRLGDPADGFMDEVHALRDRVGADLVSLMVDESDVCGIAYLVGAFSLTVSGCGFTHEVGHNMGLSHDRYQVHHNEGGTDPDPAYGYVNQRAFEVGAAPSSCWVTIMAYGTQCEDASLPVRGVARFSNPRQEYEGDPLGVPYAGRGESGVTGPADAAAVLNATAPAVAMWRNRPAGLNLAPTLAGTLPDRELTLGGALDVDVSQAFDDPDGDPLTYAVSSSVPGVVTVMAAGARLTLTAVSEGAATIRVTATDPGGLGATQAFGVAVVPAANRPPEAVGGLSPLTLDVDGASVTVEVGGAFRDPDGDALTYAAASSSSSVASAAVVGSGVTVTPVAEGVATVTVTATDAAGSNGTATQTFGVTVVPAANRPPEAVGALPPVTLGVDDAAVRVDVGGAFRDPDGDALTYAAASSAPRVVTVRAAGARVTLAAVALGRAVIEVTATDPDGLSATQTFGVRVTVPFTDDPIVPRVTPVRAVHFTELRARIDVLRSEWGLARFSWTDPVLRPRVTRVQRVHLLELRAALAEAYGAAGRAAPRWTDSSPSAGPTPIRAVHVTELRAAVLALE